MDPKIDILSQVDTRGLAIVGVSMLFLIFFSKWLGIVFGLKAYFCVYLQP